MESNKTQITPFYFNFLRNHNFKGLLRMKTKLGPEVLLYSMITVCLSFVLTLLSYYFLDADILVTTSTFGGVFLMLFYFFIKANNFLYNQDYSILSQLMDEKQITLLTVLVSFRDQINSMEGNNEKVNELFRFIFNERSSEILTTYLSTGDMLRFASRLNTTDQEKLLRYYTVNG